MNKNIFSLLLIVCGLGFNSIKAQYSNTKIQVGQKAPELMLPNVKGDTINVLAAAKKQIILLDFWASWCGPCRMASPEVVRLQNTYAKKKFKNAKKGFTVVSISLDKDKANWQSAIAADKLTWPHHYSDLGFWGSQAAKLYGIGYIPQCFLIDADGTILGKYNHIAEAEKDLVKLLK
jgi:thiol-disulfide isomerase/thioredoxin